MMHVVEIRPKRTYKPRKWTKNPAKRKNLTKDKRLTLKKADDLFSLEIRARDKNCQFPNCMVSDPKKLQNSHYIGRTTKSTRFDPDNCIALCWFHHYKSKDLGLEYQKQTLEKHGFDGQYTLLMKKRLGEERFSALVSRAKLAVKQNEAIARYQAKLVTL